MRRPRFLPVSGAVLLGLLWAAGMFAAEEGKLSSSPGVEDSARQAAPVSPNSGRPPLPGESQAGKPREAKVPEFSLPDVVITGENQLTIGAKRLERRTDDVTIGTSSLLGLDRPLNDLPGMERSRTAVSSGEDPSPKSTTFVLHAGGGTPENWGGWVLFGQEFKRMRYLAQGEAFDALGEDVAGGRLHGIRKGYRLDAWVEAGSKWDLHFARRTSRRIEDMPRSGIRAIRSGTDFKAEGTWRFTEGLKAHLLASSNDLPMEWDGAAWIEQARIREPEARIRLTADLRNPLLEGLDLIGGFRKSMGDFGPNAVDTCRQAWGEAVTRWRMGDRIHALAAVRWSRFSSFGIPGRADPRGELTILLGQRTLMSAGIRREHVAYDHYGIFLETPYVLPSGGFIRPLDVQREYRLGIQRKFGETWVVSSEASWGRWGDRMQWDDPTGGVGPIPARGPQVLGEVDFLTADSRLEFLPGLGWTIALSHLWRQGTIVAGGANLTDWPLHEARVSLARRSGSLVVEPVARFVTERNAFGNKPGILGSYGSVDLAARYGLTRNWALWVDGKNVLGARFDTAPGYPATRRQWTAGIEMTF